MKSGSMASYRAAQEPQDPPDQIDIHCSCCPKNGLFAVEACPGWKKCHEIQEIISQDYTEKR